MAGVERERGELARQWHLRRERVAYEAARAARQYRDCEPENRLVARELERRWEEALKQQRKLDAEYERWQRAAPAASSDTAVSAIRALAADLPAVWAAATTTPADRQRIARWLLDRVVVTVDKGGERVDVAMHWVGGAVRPHMLTRAVRRYDQHSDYPRLTARLRELCGGRRTAAAIADRLNAEGFHPPKRTARFTRDMVLRLYVTSATHAAFGSAASNARSRTLIVSSSTQPFSRQTSSANSACRRKLSPFCCFRDENRMYEKARDTGGASWPAALTRLATMTGAPRTDQRAAGSLFDLLQSSDPFDIATCMWYTGIEPFSMKAVPIARNLRDRKMQRALMQFFKPENYFLVRDALAQAGRADLIGGCDGLIPANPPKEAIEARRRDNDHYHTVANPAKGEPPGERGEKPTGYRPGRATQRRQDGKKRKGHF